MRVTTDALDFALAHVTRYGDTDVFPPVFEFDAIKSCWSDVRHYLSEQDMDTWTVRPERQCLSPKGTLGYRIVTQLDPLDTLLLTALVYEAGEHIEKARVPAARRVVLSHRFDPSPNGRLYSRRFTHEAFRRQSLLMANENPDGWVAMTDIADFYVRIYAHRLENALDTAVPRDHARIISKLLCQWNYSVSYGIPVGTAATRILAELSIADVDNALLGRQVRYCRYSDDFRIFASTRTEALEKLAFLAHTLYHTNGLTLQEAKTEVVRVEDFNRRFGKSADDVEWDSLEANFYDLLDILEIDTYDRIEYGDLNAEQQEAIEDLNLSEIITDRISTNRPIDKALVGFFLRRLCDSQSVSPELGELLLSRIEKLIPVFRDAAEAILRSEAPGTPMYHRLVKKLLDNPSLMHLEFYRLWILDLVRTISCSYAEPWPTLYERYNDPWTRREVTLAIGYSKNQAWIRANKRSLFELGDWQRRAFLRSASCLPKDETKFWFRTLTNRLDVLDKWVMTWARNNRLS